MKAESVLALLVLSPIEQIRCEFSGVGRWFEVGGGGEIIGNM